MKTSDESVILLNERYKLAVESAKIGIWDWDVVKNILVWDNRMYKLYGIRKKDFAGAYESWQAGVHPDDLARANEEIQHALSGEKPFDTMFRVVWKDKSVHYIKAYGKIIRSETRKPLKMKCNCRLRLRMS